jgi:hypothetical protein
MPMWKIALVKTRLAVWLPEPLTVAAWMVRSLMICWVNLSLFAADQEFYASAAPSLDSLECPDIDARRAFATSAAGAKERVARQGAHRKMRDAAAPGPSTPASAPQAPGCLGREDASALDGGTLRVLSL